MHTLLSSKQKGMITAELWEAGVAMMKQSLIRKHGGRNPEAAQKDFDDWLYRRNDPIPGDVGGPVRIRRSKP